MWIMLRPNESWLPATWLHALSPHGRRFLPNGRLSRDAKEATDGHFRLIVDDTKWHATNFQLHIELFLEGSTEGKSSRGKHCETTHIACYANERQTYIGNGNGSIYWTQTLKSHESKQRRSYMFSAGSASFLITCTVLSVLLPPTPEHKTRPSFGFSPGLGSLHLGQPYKMFCFVHHTL